MNFVFLLRGSVYFEEKFFAVDAVNECDFVGEEFFDFITLEMAYEMMFESLLFEEWNRFQKMLDSAPAEICKTFCDNFFYTVMIRIFDCGDALYVRWNRDHRGLL